MQPSLIQNYVVITTIQQGLVCGKKYLWWQGSRQPHGNFSNMNKSWFTVYEISSFSITHSVEYHEKLYLKYALLFLFFLYILTIQIKCANSWKWYMTKIILKHINHIKHGAWHSLRVVPTCTCMRFFRLTTNSGLELWSGFRASSVL